VSPLIFIRDPPVVDRIGVPPSRSSVTDECPVDDLRVAHRGVLGAERVCRRRHIPNGVEAPAVPHWPLAGYRHGPVPSIDAAITPQEPAHD
jgi:hypothetical protein